MTHVIEVPFHIGDFLSGTMHMDATEVGAYWMLCVAHYQAGEQGLPDDDVKLARIAKVSLKTWKKIRPTLAEKFTITDSFWRSSKVVDVLLKISARSANAKAKSLKRWNRDDATALQEESCGNPNHITNNQIEDTNVSSTPIVPIEDDAGVSQDDLPKPQKRVSRETVERPDWVTQETWSDFVALRKAKRAPLTATALEGIVSEAAKAGWTLQDALAECCQRGWQGFKAAWVTASPAVQPKAKSDYMDGIIAGSRQAIRGFGGGVE